MATFHCLLILYSSTLYASEAYKWSILFHLCYILWTYSHTLHFIMFSNTKNNENNNNINNNSNKVYRAFLLSTSLNKHKRSSADRREWMKNLCNGSGNKWKLGRTTRTREWASIRQIARQIIEFVFTSAVLQFILAQCISSSRSNSPSSQHFEAVPKSIVYAWEKLRNGVKK